MNAVLTLAALAASVSGGTSISAMELGRAISLLTDLSFYVVPSVSPLL